MQAAEVQLLSLITYYLSSNHSTGSRLRNVLNTKSFLSPTIHSSFPNPLLRTLVTLQPPRSTRSSFFVTLLCPPISSNLKLTGRSFSYFAPLRWNNLPPSIRQPSPKSSPQTHFQPHFTNPQPLALSRSLFHSTLNNNNNGRFICPNNLNKQAQKRANYRWPNTDSFLR
jgi:hypothetical protein